MTQHKNIIREAEPDDAIHMAALYRQLVENPALTVLPKRVAHMVDDQRAAPLVCVSDDGLRETALVSLCADAIFGHQCFAVVENSVVERAARCRGICAALLSQIEAFCLAHDCSKVMLLSSSHCEYAHRFFEGVFCWIKQARLCHIFRRSQSNSVTVAMSLIRHGRAS